MKKKATVATIIMALLVSAIVLTASFDFVQANPILNVSGVPRIEIVSPKSMLYYENSLTLSFYGNPVDWGTVEYSNIKYTIDGELRGAVDTPLAAAEVYSVNLTGLTDKQHTVEVTAIVTVKSLTTLTGGVKATVLWAPSTFTSSGKLNFTTQAPTPAPTELAPTPTPTFGATPSATPLVSPSPSAPPSQVKIENVSTHWNIKNPQQIDYNFSLNEEVSLITYALDNQANVTTTGNFTLYNLSNGNHNLTLYVTEPVGNTVQHTSTFELPQQNLERTITDVTLIAVSISVIICLVYFMKPKKSKRS
jgi:hypothetical protein